MHHTLEAVTRISLINRPRDANYLPFIQGAKTGKSRLIRELAGPKFSLIFNMGPSEGITSEGIFPPPDDDIRDLLLMNGNEAGPSPSTILKDEQRGYIAVCVQVGPNDRPADEGPVLDGLPTIRQISSRYYGDVALRRLLAVRFWWRCYDTG